MFCAANMAPGELKKYRNKQRKAKKRAELEKEKQTAAQEKREQHIKSRQQQDGEADGLKEEELVPDKLAKVLTAATSVTRSRDFSHNGRGVVIGGIWRVFSIISD